MSYYIHVTTNCNMSCAHCCFSYGNGRKGKDMPIDMFRNIMKLSSDNGEIVTIGGGEITMYENFEQMIGIIACYKNDECAPFIVTNGKNTERALLLNRLAISGIIGCELSQDEFHDPIEYKVVQAFRNRDAIRNVTKGGELISAGRAKALDHYKLRKECVCDSMQFLPTGVVKFCGCPKSPIITKNVMEPWSYPESYGDADGCYKNIVLEESLV